MRIERKKQIFPQAGQSVKEMILSILFLLTAMFLLPPGKITAASAAEPLPDVPYMLVDTGSREVLASNRPDQKWHPASLTKLMTAYVTFKALQSGEVSPGSPVYITRNARKAPPSKMGYPLNATLRMDTALQILIVKSANDVAVALAESLAGSVPAFVTRMNREANNLGMHNTNFTNPNGLHDKAQYTSAHDMLLLSGAIWNAFPQYRALFKTPSIRTEKKTHYSYNFLLERFSGATGMKTGFVCASGYNMVASAERNGRRLVAVVLGTASQTERAVTAARLLLKGFTTTSGQPLAQLASEKPSNGPTNMRSILCTEKARKARYDPAAENAVITSPYLEKRTITQKPLLVRLGNIDGDPSPAWLARAFIPDRVPTPIKRPDYTVVNVDGDAFDSSSLRGTFPVPVPSPQGLEPSVQ